MHVCMCNVYTYAIAKISEWQAFTKQNLEAISQLLLCNNHIVVVACLCGTTSYI